MSRFHLFTHLLHDLSTPLAAPAGSLPDLDERLHAAYGWLSASIRAVQGKGSAKSYSYLKGWSSAYPETSGYIISTLLRYEETFQQTAARQQAEGLARWLHDQHNPDGGIYSRKEGPGSPSLVFDTGMVLHGYTDLYRATGQHTALENAQRCARFLVSAQHSDGSWWQCYNQIPHAYHARVSWPLLQYALLTNDRAAQECAHHNLNWVTAQQAENGFWDYAYFTPQRPYANTHSLGYIMEGLIESYRLAGEEHWLTSAALAADRLLAHFEQHGYLPGYFNADWQEQRIVPFSFACLTGSVQIARCWLLLGQITGKSHYTAAGLNGLAWVLRYQDIQTSDTDVRGGLPGSTPVIGGYLPLQLPNWAAKFLMDTLFEARTVL